MTRVLTSDGMGAHGTIERLHEPLVGDGRIAAAIVFGSQVRGHARPDSDIDVAVLYDSEPERLDIERDLISVLGRLGKAAGTNVHLVDLDRADLPLQHAVFDHGKVLFDRSGGRLKALEHATAIRYVDADYHRRLILATQRRALERQLGRS